MQWYIKKKAIILKEPYSVNLLTNNLIFMLYQNIVAHKKIVSHTVNKEDEYQRNCAIVKRKLLGGKSNEVNLNKKLNKVDLIERKEFLYKIK